MFYKLVFISLLISTSWVYSASFDCTKAKSKSELAICSDKELDELDSQLGISYAELKKVFSPNFFKKIIQKSQSNWIKSVNSNFNSTNDLAYLKKEYKERIQLLKISLNPVFGYKTFQNKIDSSDPFIIKIQKSSDAIEILSNDLFMSKSEFYDSGEDRGLSPKCYTYNKLFRKSDGKLLKFEDVFEVKNKNNLVEKIYQLTKKQLEERGSTYTKKEITDDIINKLDSGFNEIKINSKLFSVNHFLTLDSACIDSEINIPTKSLEQFFTPYIRKQISF